MPNQQARALNLAPLPERINRAGIVLRPETPDLVDYYVRVKRAFEEHYIEVMLDLDSARMIGAVGTEFETMCRQCDILVSIGGDGTLLSVVRRSFEFQKPVLGVNMGRLGFLTDLQKEEIENFVAKIVDKQYRIDKRMVIEANIDCNDETTTMLAFNDVVINRKNISSMVRLRASIDGNPFNTYYGDGLIIATPTGSTAYNISAGGPVVYPFSRIFVMTPISPHSLTQRPLVLPAEFEIELEVEDDHIATVVLDGQEMKELLPGECLRITTAQKPAQLIHRLERNYFYVLREKFKWGD